jgi:two-component system sensor histidine kinase CreC
VLIGAKRGSAAFADELAHASQSVAAKRRVRIQVVRHHATVEADPCCAAPSAICWTTPWISHEGGLVELGLHLEGRWVCITVRDQGSGIPAYAQDKVLEKFYSLERPHSRKKSTGLGLSFVKEIASLHRGRVELNNRDESDASPGAIATLWLPRSRTA